MGCSQLHYIFPVLIAVLLHSAQLEAGDAAVLGPSQALALARKVLAQGDVAKRETLLATGPDGPVGVKDLAAMIRLLAPTAPEKALKPGIHDLTLAVPTEISDKPVEYALYVPAKHNPRTPYALMIGLHGGGQDSGSGKNHMRMSAKTIAQLDMLYACPTSVDRDIKRYWRNERNEAMFIALINELSRIYPIDSDRVYLTGYSMGGIGCYVLGARMAARFAAVAPGGGSWSGVYWPSYRNTPVYIWHGRQDLRGKMFTDFPNAVTADEILTQLGIEHQLQAMDCGHSYPPDADLPMYGWLLRHKRATLAKRITMASPCTRDFMGEAPPSPRNLWLAIDEIGPDRLEMDGVELGGTPRMKHTLPMGTLDAAWTALNRLEVSAVNVKRFRIFLAHGLVDATKPLSVVVNGTAAYEGPVPNSARYLIRWLAEQRDGGFPCIGELPIAVPTPAK